MASEDVARLERLLAWRRSEEEIARQREAEALRAVERARTDLRGLREQLRRSRVDAGHVATEAEQLIDAHHCTARLVERVRERERALERAQAHVTRARKALAAAGRRRLAVERLAGTRALQERARECIAAQVDLDESGRLRLLLEGD